MVFCILDGYSFPVYASRLYYSDMTWSERRKLAYGGGFFLILISIVAFIIVRLTSVTPTCFDGKRNGDETGVDCGGGCLQYCRNELSDPKVRWVRSFEIAPGVVHAVAYIEHSFATAAAKDVGYQFKLYDAKNSLITEYSGTTIIGPIGRSAIVATLIPTGNSDVAVTRFSFTAPVPWQKIDTSIAQSVIKTDRTVLENFSEGTRLTAVIDNPNRITFNAMEVVALLYDERDNAVTTSKTVIERFPAGSTQTLYFTWPQTITPDSIRRIEIIPRINPFDTVSL